METEAKNALFSAVIKLLRPLVRIFLRNGLPFRAFADLARWVYVDVAISEFGLKGKKPSDSRVSIITGLSRKEVRRLKNLQQPEDTDAHDRYHRAARVISGWTRDHRFSDAKGEPKALHFEKGKGNFSELVKSFSGDVPARAILDELVHVGAVKIMPSGKIQLQVRAYLPTGDAPDMLAILGADVSHLITTIDYNISSDTQEPYFQRKVSYDNVAAEAIPEFRQVTTEQGQQLLEKLDHLLSQHDRDVNPARGGTGRKQVGVGVYYFEKDLEPKDSKP